MLTSSALYLASVAATLLHTDAVVQSEQFPSLCMKPATGEWIIVNPADPAGPVLGYGTLSEEALRNNPQAVTDQIPQLSCNILSWLKFIEDAQDYISRHPQAAVTPAQRKALAPAVGVDPLMPQIMWDQGTPYNKFTPPGTPTGCVATALSQIMYFFGYPEHGFGSHSYNWQGQTLSVDFSEQTYNWDLMFDSYDRNIHTEEQIDEVAKLNYHVGIAMDMGYNAGGSGAYDMRVNEKMNSYFGYNPYGTVINRFSFGLASWSAIMNRELSLGHPVYMSGSSSEGGHAFVIDGVNTEGYYHVNWGWGGYYNGWFDISIMRPEGVGTGASPSDDGFAWNQLIYAGFTPDVPADSIYYTTLQDYYLDAEILADTIYSNIWLINTSASSQKGTVYFDLMQGEDLLDRQEVFADKSYRYWEAGGGMVQYTIPADLPDGDYRVEMSFQNRQGLWSKIHGYRPTPDYIRLTVQDGKKSVSANEIDVKMSMKDYQFSEVYAGQDNRMSFLMQNEGEEIVAGLWYLRLIFDDGTVLDTEATNIYTLEADQQKWVDFIVNPSNVGHCIAEIGLFRQSEDDYTLFEVPDSKIELEVINDGTFGSALSLSDPLFIESGDCEVNGTVTIGIPLKNEADAYNGDLMLRIFSDQKMSKEVMTCSAGFQIGSNETELGRITVLLDQVKAKKRYFAAAYMRKGDKFVKIPGEGNQLTLSVYEEGHAAGIETIQTDDVLMPQYDLFGHPLNGTSNTGFIIRNRQVTTLVR